MNWRLFSHRFFNNLKMLLSSSWAILSRAFVFPFSPRVNFSSLKYLCFSFLLVFLSIHSYLVQKSLSKNNYIIIKTEKFQLCFDTKSIDLFWYNKSQSRFFLFNYKLQCNDFENLNQRWYVTKIFRRIIERVFCCPRNLKTSWMEHCSKFNKQGMRNKNVLGGKISKS